MDVAIQAMAAPPTQYSAPNRVFSITELVEIILDIHDISLEQLYTLQRVNTTFWDVINNSKALQTKM